MVEFRAVKKGDKLFEHMRDRWGNVSYWPVAVLELEADRALVSWNHNTPTWYYPHDFKQLRRTPPKRSGK